MGDLPKKYGPPREPGEKTANQKATGRNNELRWSLRIGEITRVDYEYMHCDITFLSGSRPPALEVPISSAYWSKRGFLGAMPEKGSLVVCGFMDVHQGEATHPLILSFLPNGSKTALRYHPLSGTGERDAEEVDLPDEATFNELDDIYDVDRHKMRKLYPGDIFGMSDQGSEILLNRNVRLFSKSGSEFQLRSEDSAALLTSQDYYRTTAASRKRSGKVVRNGLNLPSDSIEDGKISEDYPLFDDLVENGLIFEDGTLVDDVNSLPFSRLSSGERHSVITQNRTNPDNFQSQAFVEERTEIQEFSDQRTPQGVELGFDSDRIVGEDHFNPFIESVTGTVIGNDPLTSKGRSRYGELLRPSIFKSPEDTDGEPEMEVVPNNASEQEKNLVAANLYRMQRPDGLGELFFSHDKEGHVFFSIPASTSKASNLGAGRSIEGDIRGSTKLTMGSNRSDGESMDVDADGGFKWNLGTVNSSNRSLELRAEGGLSFDVRGSDIDGSAFNGKFTGNYGVSITGNKGESISGKYVQEVGGKKDVSASSLTHSVGEGGMDRTITDDKNENVTGHVSEQIGKGHETTITKPDQGDTNARKLDIKRGDRTVSFLAPAEDKIEFTSSGTITREATASLDYTMETQGAGNFTTEANTGSYSVKLSTGSISLTSSGGTVDITAGVTVSIESANINLTGTVGLGAGSNSPHAVIGGNAGPSPHLDYIVGIPLLGNPQVKTV